MSTYDLLILLQLLASLAGQPSMNVQSTNMIDLVGNPQQLYSLSIDTDYISLYNKLSFDLVYGFDTTSHMVDEEQALFGVNGGFYDEYGRTLGALIKDYQLISLQSANLPDLILLDDQWLIDDLVISMKFITPHETMTVGGMNIPTSPRTTVLMTSDYGKTTKVTQPNISYVVINDKIQTVVAGIEPVPIPLDGYVIVRTLEADESLVDKYNLKIGDKVSLDYQTHNEYLPLQQIKEAIQGGGWLVKDGMNVAKAQEDYIGNTNIPQPRTVVGISQGNKVMFVIADGRQPGYSIGLTGRALADIMINNGVTEAMYLDGGASSTLVIDHKVINRPSNGEERSISHALLGKYQIPDFSKNIFLEW